MVIVSLHCWLGKHSSSNTLSCAAPTGFWTHTATDVAVLLRKLLQLFCVCMCVWGRCKGACVEVGRQLVGTSLSTMRVPRIRSGHQAWWQVTTLWAISLFLAISFEILKRSALGKGWAKSHALPPWLPCVKHSTRVSYLMQFRISVSSTEWQRKPCHRGDT